MARNQHAGKQLNRNTHQRKALFKGLINSLIMKEEIKTTVSKAKAIQGLFDKLVTKGKLGTVHARRLLHAFLGSSDSVKKLVDELAPRLDKRTSGYTRIVKVGVRRGDNAQMVKIALVDEKPVVTKEKSAPKTKAKIK